MCEQIRIRERQKYDELFDQNSRDDCINLRTALFDGDDKKGRAT